jgi:hypothetical protein
LGVREPLNLPRGSVRAIVTIILVLVAAVALFAPIAEGADDVKSMWLLLTGIAVRDYFAHRKEQNEEAGPAVEPPDYADER